MTCWLLMIAFACQPADEAAPRMFPAVDPQAAIRVTRQARDTAQGAIERLNLKLIESESEHFLLYTDWPTADAKALGAHLEQTYSAVARQFGVRRGDEIFIGKLLAIALRLRADFEKLAQDLDEEQPPPNSLGYFRAHADGGGHLFVCWPAVAEDAAPHEKTLARDRFRAMLAAEMSLAFLDRYRGQGDLPAWINRGIATLVQRRILPEQRVDPSLIKRLASGGFDLTVIFDPEVSANPQYDAAAASVVAMLIERDRAAFVAMLEAAKSGVAAEQALQRSFGIDYQKLSDQWRTHAQSRPDP